MNRVLVSSVCAFSIVSIRKIPFQLILLWTLIACVEYHRFIYFISLIFIKKKQTHTHTHFTSGAGTRWVIANEKYSPSNGSTVTHTHTPIQVIVFSLRTKVSNISMALHHSWSVCRVLFIFSFRGAWLNRAPRNSPICWTCRHSSTFSFIIFGFQTVFRMFCWLWLKSQ